MSRRSGWGWLALVPAAVALAVTYVWPSLWTLTTSFQRNINRISIHETPAVQAMYRPSWVGLANYLAVAGPFGRAVGTSLQFAVFAVLAVLVVAPLLAVAAHVAGAKARLRIRAALAVPMLWVAPTAVVATAATFWTQYHGPTGFALTRMVVWTATFGLTTGLATTCYLAVLRRWTGDRRPVFAMLVVAGVALCAVLAYALQAFNYAAPYGPYAGLDSPGATPLRLADRVYSGTGNLGIGTAVDVLLLVILGVLGVFATALVVFSRLRVEVEPAERGTRPEAGAAPDAAPPARTRTRARIAAAVILLVLAGITVFSLVPWLSAMAHAGDLAMRAPFRLSAPRILAYTWIPPLISTVVAVGVGVLGGYGIGALRPMGRWSELLLLPFGPWLFVGVGPLAIQASTWRQHPNAPSTFLDLVPPIWLSIPALFLATLVFRATRLRHGLPLLGLLGLATWIGYAQSAVWPSRERTTGPLMVWRPDGSNIGLASTWPVVILVAVGLAVVQRKYLDRLVLSVESAATRTGPPATRVTTIPAPVGAWPSAPSVAATQAPVPPPASPPATPPTPLPGDHHRSPAGRRLNVKLIALVTAVCVAGFVALVVVILPKASSSPSAADTVTAFYAALADRNAIRARTMLAPGGDHQTNPTLLNDQTLRDPGYTPPSQVKVTQLPDSGTGQQGLGYEYTGVQVDCVIAGVAERQRVRLSRAAGARLGPWRIIDGVGYLPLEPDLLNPTLVVAGTRYTSYGGSIDVFPGAYVVTLRHPIFVAGPVTIRTGGPYTHLKLDITPTMRANANTTVRERIDNCAHEADPMKDYECPFYDQLTFPGLPQAGRPFQLSLTVLIYPAFTVQVAGSITVRTTTPGQVRAVESDRTTGKPVFDQTEPFTVTGYIENLDDGNLWFKVIPASLLK